MDQDIILFRYHHNIDLVKNRLQLLKMMEPDKPIFGIYGGKHSDFKEAADVLNGWLENNFLIPVDDGKWKWLHGDITFKMWYQKVGKHIRFEDAYIVEWDLLILEALYNLYPTTNQNRIFCTGLIPLEKVSNFWYWMNEKNKPKVEAFFKQVQDYYKTPFIRYASLGPGLCAPRSFFEGLLDLRLFEADISDELKIPVWSQIMGLTPMANDFYKKWFSFFEMRCFNANMRNIRYRTIARELNKKNGRRVFHPFGEAVEPNKLYRLYKNSSYTRDAASMKYGEEVKTIHPAFYKLHCKLFDLQCKIS